MSAAGIAGDAAMGAAAGSVVPGIGTVIGGAIGAIGGVLGAWLGNKGKKEASAILDRARDKYGNISLPALKDIAVKELGPSALGAIKEDPEYRSAMKRAYGKLSEIGDQGGLLLEDKAALNDTVGKVQQRNAAERAGIKESFARRGMANSGNELLQALQGQSAGAEQLSKAGTDVAAGAQKRAYQAILDRENMAKGADEMDYQRKARKAEANDSIARFNAGLSLQTQEANNALRQQQFSNQMDIYGREDNLDMARANIKAGQAAQTQAMVAGVSNAVGGIASEFDRRRRPRPTPDDNEDPYAGTI